MYETLGQEKEALAAIKKVFSASTSPCSRELQHRARGALVRLYAASGEARKAQPFFKGIVPDAVPALLADLGEAYLRANDGRSAGLVWRDALELDPAGLCARARLLAAERAGQPVVRELERHVASRCK